MALLKIKDENGQEHEIVALRGPRGLKGEDAYAKVVEYGYEGDEEEFYLAMSRNGTMPDTTLTKPGVAADAKETGDKLTEVNERIDGIEHGALLELEEGKVSRYGNESMNGNLTICKDNPSIFVDGENGAHGFMTYDVVNKRLDIGLEDYERQADPETGEPGFVLGDPDCYHPSYGAKLRIGMVDEWHELGFQPQFVDEDGNAQVIMTAANLFVCGVPKIVCGSYKGDGKSGASNPTSITFDFVPKFVMVSAGDTHSLVLMWYMGVTKAKAGATTSGTVSCQLSGTTLSWYSSVNSDQQYNTSGSTYYWVAFG